MQSNKFVALPHSTKMLAPHPPGGSHHRGYSSPGLEKVSQHEYDANELAKLRSIPDYKESFESGNPDDTAQPNIWPPDDALPGFRVAMQHFFTLCVALIHRVLDALSIALNVPEQGLSPTHSLSLFQLRLLHYPSLPLAQLQQHQRTRISAHSDFGTLTLLWQDQIGGLEIEDPKQEGVWRKVEPVEGAVLVNVGDLMARWANGRWRSSVHRVVEPSSAVASEGGEVQHGEAGLASADGEDGGEVMLPDRYSIPVFATANMDTVIKALPGTWSAESPKKFESVTAWEYVQMRMKALYED